MPLPEHTTKLPEGIAMIDGKPYLTPKAILHVIDTLSPEETFELTIYASEDTSNYCARCTEWLFQHGKVSV